MADFWSLTHTANPGKPTATMDPDATLDIPFNWAPWMEDIDDSIKSSEIIVDAPLTVVKKNVEGHVVAPFITGVVAGAVHAVLCRVTTNSTPPRVEDQTVYLFGKQN